MMTPSQPAEAAWEYSLRARNISVNAENKIHDDAGARSLGFAGGLVPGVTVYAYMTHPLVARFGEDALQGTVSRAAFFAPVYEGDDVRIELAPAAPASLTDGVTLTARKGAEPVAILEVSRPPALPAPGAWPDFSPRNDEVRPAFDWREVVVGRAFHGFRWKPSEADQRAWCDSVADELPLYGAGSHPPCHPGWVLQQANFTIGREFRMTPWIHVSSRLIWHGAIQVGEPFEVRAVPVEKWEKKGGRYALLRVLIASAGKALLEIEHKAILQVAPR